MTADRSRTATVGIDIALTAHARIAPTRVSIARGRIRHIRIEAGAIPLADSSGGALISVVGAEVGEWSTSTLIAGQATGAILLGILPRGDILASTIAIRDLARRTLTVRIGPLSHRYTRSLTVACLEFQALAQWVVVPNDEFASPLQIALLTDAAVMSALTLSGRSLGDAGSLNIAAAHLRIGTAFFAETVQIAAHARRAACHAGGADGVSAAAQIGAATR
ncbi:MAG: hypothetical protein IT335_09195 [Thermomicrobiales bacterium]|jgi:hypothetical protein|nr:hypothetical protein [Thermomicrobiales bacterium]